MTIASFKRQMGILPPNLLNRRPYVLIGAGGIGSPIAFTITKMGVSKLSIWDGDKIESHNLPNQFYKLNQIGRYKAASLAANVAEFAEVAVTANNRMYDGSPLTGIVISAVHSIEGRQEIWQGVVKSPRTSLYIETRMAGELFQVYPIPMDDEERKAAYAEKLFRKVKVHRAPCTAAAVFYTVMNCAGVVGEVIKSYLTQKEALPRCITVDLNRFKMMVE